MEGRTGEKELAALVEGQKLAEWSVVKKLGEGGFGAVYGVRSTGRHGADMYAMKVEKATENVKVLKMEVYVLNELQKANAQHCCALVDSGRADDYNFVVMTLVGTSLQDLRRRSPYPSRQKFNLDTCINVGVQSLEAVRELHNVGFLHRDLKPANFAVSLKDNKHIVMLDFGMARKYFDMFGQIRKPRWAVGFRGTLRYAPLSCHVSRETCRKDDLETWMYMMIEVTNAQLPWKDVENKDEVGRMKERSREDESLFQGVPTQYRTMLQYVDALRYYEEPDYDVLHDELKSIKPGGPCEIEWETVEEQPS